MASMKQPKPGGRPDANPTAMHGFLRSTETGLYLPDRLAGPYQYSGAEWFSARARWHDFIHSIKNYLLARGAHRVLGPNRRLQGRYKELGTRMMALLRKRPGGHW